MEKLDGGDEEECGTVQRAGVRDDGGVPVTEVTSSTH